MYEFNQFIKNGKATMSKFFGALSYQTFHHLDAHIEGRKINTVVLHVRISDTVTCRSSNELLQNIKNISLKYKKN